MLCPSLLFTKTPISLSLKCKVTFDASFLHLTFIGQINYTLIKLSLSYHSLPASSVHLFSSLSPSLSHSLHFTVKCCVIHCARKMLHTKWYVLSGDVFDCFHFTSRQLYFTAMWKYAHFTGAVEWQSCALDTFHMLFPYAREKRRMKE